MSVPRQIVIVGANLAGGRAAETLRKEGFEGRVVLIGEEPDRPYERPPLSKDVLEGITAADSTYLRDEGWYAEQRIEVRLGVRATRLDPAGSVDLDSGESIPFDACLLATGSRLRKLPVPGADLAGVVYLRTLRDALALEEALRARPRVVVVGAGFIGLEVASSARFRGCEVTVLEALELPLARVLPPDVARVLADLHTGEGVELRLSEGVDRFDGAGRVEAVISSAGRRYEADLVVVGVGVAPADELARDAGIACDDGIVVDGSCRTAHPNVFAAGDVARHPNPILGRTIRVEHFQNAQDQGVAAARAMLGAPVAFGQVPWFWSNQFHHNLQTLGHAPPHAGLVVRGSLAGRSFTAFQLDGERIIGAIAMDRPRDIAAARRLIERGVATDRATLADEDADLRTLLK